MNFIQTPEMNFVGNPIKTFIPGKPQPDISFMELNLNFFLKVQVWPQKKSVNNFTQHQFKFNVHQDLLFEQKKAMNITEAILYAKLDELYLKGSNVPKVSRLCQIIF